MACRHTDGDYSGLTYGLYAHTGVLLMDHNKLLVVGLNLAR